MHNTRQSVYCVYGNSLPDFAIHNMVICIDLYMIMKVSKNCLEATLQPRRQCMW